MFTQPPRSAPAQIRQAPRKPKKPTMSISKPINEETKLCPSISLALPSSLYLPIRGPRFRSTPNANQPAIVCTTPAAATSCYPHPVPNQPSGCHPQAAPSIQTTDPKITAKNVKALILIRSITAPENIDAVVHANKVNAAQKTPVA